MREVPPLPAGEGLPSFRTVSELLSQALLLADRSEGTQLLEEKILPARMIGVTEDMEPRRVLEIIYDELVWALQEVDPGERLGVLRTASRRAEISEQRPVALAMAIARYLKDHPKDTAAAQPWMTPLVERWRSTSLAELEREANQRLELLRGWRKEMIDEDFDSWATERVNWLHAKNSLEAARSGVFRTASGSLHDFLEEVGAPVDHLDVF